MGSANRVPYAGQEGALPGTGTLALQARAGPLARSIRDCEMFMRTVADAKPWLVDPAVVAGDWAAMDFSVRSMQDSESRPKGLTFGVIHTDGMYVNIRLLAILITGYMLVATD